MRSELESLMDQQQELRQEVVKLEGLKREQQAKIAALKQEKRQIEQVIEAVQEELEDKRKEYHTLREHYKTIEKEVAQKKILLKKQMESVQVIQNRCREREGDMYAARHAYQYATRQGKGLASLEPVRAKFEEALQAHKDALEELKQALAAVVAIKQEIACCEEKDAKLKLETLANKIAALSAKLEKLKKKLSDIDSELVSVEFDERSTDMSLSLRREELRQLAEQIVHMRNAEPPENVERVESEDLAQLKIEAEASKRLLEEAEEELNNLYARQESLNAQEQSIRSQLDVVQQEKVSFEKEFRAQENAIEQQALFIEELQEKRQALSRQQLAKSEGCTELESKIREQKVKIAGCESRETYWEAELASKQAALARKSAELEDLRRQAAGFICEHHTLNQMAAGICGNINKLPGNLAARARELVGKMMAVTTEIGVLQGDVERAQAELRPIAEELDRERTVLSRLQDRLMQAKQEKKDIESEIEKVDKALAAARKEHVELQKGAEQIRVKIQRCSSQEAELRSRLSGIHSQQVLLVGQIMEKEIGVEAARAASDEAILTYRAFKEMLDEESRAPRR